MEQTIRILMLEDSETDAMLAVQEIKKAGIPFEWKRVDSKESFHRALKDFGADIILADYSLPGFDGRTALLEARTFQPDTPFVFVTGTLGEELAIDMLKEGATDYVLKEGLGRLGPAVERAIRERDERRKRAAAERAHTESLLRYRRVIENASDVIFTTDKNGNFTYANEAGMRISGYSMGELWRKNYLDLIPVEHQNRVHFHYARQMLSRRTSSHIEFPFRRKDGSVAWFSQNASLVLENGEFQGFQVISHDITERKTLEEAYRLVVDHSLQGLLIYQNGRIKFANHSYAETLGYGTDELLAMDPEGVLNIIHEDHRETVKATLLRKPEEQDSEEYEIKIIHKDGTVRWLRIRSVFAAYLGQPALQISTLNITNEKWAERAREKAQAELERSEQKYRDIFTRAPVGIYQSTRDGTILTANQRLATLLGYSSVQEVLKRNMKSIVLTEQDSSETYELSGPAKNLEVLWKRKDGAPVWVQLNAHTTKNHENKLEYVEGFVTDITERKLAEQQLMHSSEQLRALATRLQSVREDEQTRIAREIHDELGQALTGLKMDLAWVDKRIQGSAGIQASVVSEKIRSMFILIDETVRMVRRISSELRPGALDDLGLVAAIEWQLNEFSERTGIKGKFRPGSNDVELDRDRSTAIFRIFQESLTNVARHSSATRVAVTLLQDKEQLELRVQDNGRGITAEEIDKTTSLGILGMRERALVFNGHVDFQANPGKGTTVIVTIPVSSVTARGDSPMNEETTQGST